MTHTSFFRVWTTLLAAVLAVILLSVAAPTTGAGAQEAGCRGQVVLDAGHGGTDPGAVNSKYDLTEMEQTLDVAKRLETLLEGDGYTVCMTRTSNSQTLSNNDRYTYANTTGADILVSIHMNGSSNPSTDYTTTLFGKWRKDKELANTVFGSLSTLPAANGTGTIATRTPYSFASGVLLKSNMPATIAETVFITNDREGQLLSNGTGARQQQIAEALRVGIEDYLTTH
ncbi:MAG: N-acetylmuramoyl-L-alanine amidase [Actinomycetota bacterium]|nr:N-acetylmuramoyl-L-alanine amidase [Rubrobacteraceae bacterium]MDQ3251069.1 N-acetylmuramoyl-L-alanine amidase [Actinomycetota bacterium]MDQ3435729.1 N-acetylmuramoyl-L-alanine amidase [Actinomycetota bacterium]